MRFHSMTSPPLRHLMNDAVMAIATQPLMRTKPLSMVKSTSVSLLRNLQQDSATKHAKPSLSFQKPRKAWIWGTLLKRFHCICWLPFCHRTTSRLTTSTAFQPFRTTAPCLPCKEETCPLMKVHVLSTTVHNKPSEFNQTPTSFLSVGVGPSKARSLNSWKSRATAPPDSADRSRKEETATAKTSSPSGTGPRAQLQIVVARSATVACRKTPGRNTKSVGQPSSPNAEASNSLRCDSNSTKSEAADKGLMEASSSSASRKTTAAAAICSPGASCAGTSAWLMRCFRAASSVARFASACFAFCSSSSRRVFSNASSRARLAASAFARFSSASLRLRSASSAAFRCASATDWSFLSSAGFALDEEEAATEEEDALTPLGTALAGARTGLESGNSPDLRGVAIVEASSCNSAFKRPASAKSSFLIALCFRSSRAANFCSNSAFGALLEALALGPDSDGVSTSKQDSSNSFRSS
mmetsp:Transcript_126755/g.366919  ORF Transcript_126755/g.366919 Transcript_126755/m.366919 type:complete len:470 (+) Transcript_126755:68-1477(+)